STDGLRDPNLGRFLDRLAEYEARNQVSTRHYRLVTNQEYQPPQGRVHCLPYGDNHDELADFLRSLIPSAPESPVLGIAAQDLTTPPTSPPPAVTVTQLDDVLRSYGAARVAEWQKARTDLEDRHRLFYYVPPHYSYIDKAIDKENKQQRITGKTDDVSWGSCCG
ncbi:MAG: hypothetical protein ACKPEY_02630, partial [Planctomycetota bacterium]